MKALEYVKTPPTPHTSNRWTVNEYGNHEMSNMVYRFSWREYEHTEWDRTLEKSVPKSWELTWSVTFNTPHNPDYSGDGWKIAGQDRKIFRDRASMEKYLQGRIAAYADLFVEICPPIPTEHKDRFSINGQLMPCWTAWTTRICWRCLLSLLRNSIPKRKTTRSKRNIPRHGRTAALCVAVPASMEF